MKKKPLEIVHVAFLLDQTGSMLAFREETIKGFNDYLDELEDEGNVRLTLTLFNSEKIEKRTIAARLSDVPRLSDMNYRPNATTPLFDAICQTIKKMEEQVPEDSRVLFTIQTDGMENASIEYNALSVRKMIDEKKAAGWTFAFLGADMDAFTAAAGLGINRAQTMSYAGAAAGEAFANLATTSKGFTRGGGFNFPDEGVEDEDVEV